MPMKIGPCSLRFYYDDNCHRNTELPCDLSEQHRCIIQSVLQFVQYQDPFPDSNFNSSLSPSLVHNAIKRFSQSSHSTTLSDAFNISQRQH